MPVDQSQLNKRFDLHPTTQETGPTMDTLRALHKQLAATVVELTPESREQSLALTKIEESLFYANAAVARNTDELESMAYDGSHRSYMQILDWMREAGSTVAQANEVIFSTPVMYWPSPVGMQLARPGEKVFKHGQHDFRTVTYRA